MNNLNFMFGHELVLDSYLQLYISTVLWVWKPSHNCGGHFVGRTWCEQQTMKAQWAQNWKAGGPVPSYVHPSYILQKQTSSLAMPSGMQHGNISNIYILSLYYFIEMIGFLVKIIRTVIDRWFPTSTRRLNFQTGFILDTVPGKRVKS